MREDITGLESSCDGKTSLESSGLSFHPAVATLDHGLLLTGRLG